MSLADKRWAKKAQALQFDQLERMRTTAERWRNGLTGLTGVLTAVAILKGKENVGDLSAGGRRLVIWLLAVALLLLLIGSFAAMRAAFGFPGTGIELSGEELQQWERNELRVGQSYLQVAALTFVTGVLLVAIATGVTWVDEPPRKLFVAVQSGKQAICGELIRADHKTLVLRVSDGSGESVTRRVAFKDVRKLVPRSACD